MLSIQSDEHFMKEALKEAQKGFEAGEIPVGAVVVANNQIIARAHNQVELLKDPTAHAEIIAITSATNTLGSKFLEDCTLYVTLEPCCMCAGATFWSHLTKIVYGCPDEKRGFSIFSKKMIHPKCTVVGGVLAGASEVLLQEFFKKLRKR